jgi:fructokinase
MLGGIEAGGTKFVCGVGTSSADLESIEIPTTSPAETMPRVIDFFRGRKSLRALGIGSFGPVDPRPSSPTFGYITSTPKTGWKDFDLAGTVRSALAVPVAFDTDVNAAAFGEHRWGAAAGVDTFLYVTVGTGIGGGAMLEGRLHHGRVHPEMGHVRVPHDRALDPFPGTCPYHGDCLEGLASASAIERRWGCAPHLLQDDHPAWRLEADYLALGLVGWIASLSPELVILGGGIMRREGLMPLVRARVAALMNGYMELPDIVAPALGARSGVLGALALAHDVSACH